MVSPHAFTSIAFYTIDYLSHTAAIRIAHSKGIIHHDVSHRNILWYNHEGTPRGLLIDYDGAHFVDRNNDSRINVRHHR